VGPVWSKDEDRTALLASCYEQSLKLARELGAETIAFPAISTGIFGWPIDDGAEIAIRAAREHGGAPLREIRFVLFDETAYQAFAQVLGG
jgi:O-acetyl-ADP-ribose deacetylase (regulator of RNase III)